MDELINVMFLLASKLDDVCVKLDDVAFRLDSIEGEIKRLGNNYDLKDIHSQLELMDMSLNNIESNTSG